MLNCSISASFPSFQWCIVSASDTHCLALVQLCRNYATLDVKLFSTTLQFSLVLLWLSRRFEAARVLAAEVDESVANSPYLAQRAV